MRVNLLWDENPMTRILEPTETMLVPIASKRGLQAPIQGKEVSFTQKGNYRKGYAVCINWLRSSNPLVVKST